VNYQRRQILKSLGGVCLSSQYGLSVGQESQTVSKGADPPTKPVSIDIGRQLLVDDYLIAATSFKRTFHKPTLYENNPILRPETELELHWGMCPAAVTFEDGVFYDPKDRLFKMWYMAGWYNASCYAVSEDGFHWKRPALDIEAGTNRILAKRGRFQRDGAAVWLDHEAGDPDERFKMFSYFRNKKNIGYVYGELYPVGSPNDWEGGEIFTSPDGIHWKFRGKTGVPCGDNSGMFYDPFRKVWVYSVRIYNQRGRIRGYRSHGDFVKGAEWSAGDVRIWQTADDLDRPEPNLGYQTQLYKVGAVAYESLMVSLHAIHRGPPNEICGPGGFPKFVDLTVGYSRDGFNFHRPDREAFIAGSRVRGTWNRAYIHSAGGVCLIVGDNLHFYFGAWSGISPRLDGHMYAGGSTGLAILRRDGFASLDAGSVQGVLITRPVLFSGNHLFVNCSVPRGELRAEVLDERGRPIAPFTAGSCIPVRVDKTLQRVAWTSGENLSRFRDRPVQFRFTMTAGSLYSFWVSPDESGSSRGYVAAGGPGFTGPIDTVGGGSAAG
jgi:hypothetical protein